METLREIDQQVQQIRALRDIVHSMRTLASTYLKRAEDQLASTRLYRETVAAALGVTLEPERAAEGAARGRPAPGPEAIVLFATEQGLCGRFNEVMVEALGRRLAEHAGARAIVLGQRGRGVAEAAGIRVLRAYPAVTSPEAIHRAVRSAAEELYQLYATGEVSAIYLLHAVHESVGRFAERFERVLPLDPQVLGERGRPTGPAPLTYVPLPALRERLIEEYYFIRFYWAFVETVASENSVRLQSMEAARSNIEETLADLEGRRRILRQDAITEELMDVIAGAEAATAMRNAK